MDNYDDNDNPIPDMDNHYETLMEFLTDNDAMRRTAVGSMRQGLYAGGGAVAGGLLLGPVGGLLGGLAGSLVGYFRATDYHGAVQQIARLERGHRRDRLVQAVRLSLLHAGANARSFASPLQFQQVLLQFAGQSHVRDQIWKACVDSLEQ